MRVCVCPDVCSVFLSFVSLSLSAHTLIHTHTYIYTNILIYTHTHIYIYTHRDENSRVLRLNIENLRDKIKIEKGKAQSLRKRTRYSTCVYVLCVC